MFMLLSQLAGSTVDGVPFLPIAIVLCAIFFEDLTAVFVGVLAADGIISVPSAIISLCAGIALGDTVLYSIGFFASTHPRFARYINHKFTVSFRSWLENRYLPIIFSGHFVPGLRFTTYIASGFFRRPLSVFVPSAIASGLILGTTLFSVSYWFGNVTSEWLGPVRWGIALVFIMAIFFMGRRNLLAYQEKKQIRA